MISIRTYTSISSLLSWSAVSRDAHGLGCAGAVHSLHQLFHFHYKCVVHRKAEALDLHYASPTWPSNALRLRHLRASCTSVQHPPPPAAVQPADSADIMAHQYQTSPGHFRLLAFSLLTVHAWDITSIWSPCLLFCSFPTFPAVLSCSSSLSVSLLSHHIPPSPLYQGLPPNPEHQLSHIH